MIEIKCSTCRSQLIVDDDWAGRLLTCPDCDAKLRVPSFPWQTPRRSDIVVRLTGQGRLILVDMITLPILVDGLQVGEGSVKKGFDVVVRMPAGKHTVAIGPASHEVDVPRDDYCEMEFEFSRMWGKYSLPPRVRSVDAEEANDWPTTRDGTKPVELVVEEGGIAPHDQAVLDELERLDTQKAGWGASIAWLVVSLLLYMAAARIQDIWDQLLIIIPVLAFHEAGHYLAMRCFGYRNLRIFFIPFFGAAVSGKHYNVAGWKKAVVALAGPIPGIVAGSILGVVGLIANEPTVINVAMLMVILNGFNLLPFVPLDGGWVLHAVLFARHPVLDIVSRVIAGLCLIGVAYFADAWCIVAVGVLMLLAAPFAYRMASIAQRLGQEGLVTRSDDGDSIPREAALQILAELHTIFPPQTPAKAMAQHIATVFESFNAEPPGALASTALLFVHAGGFIMALVMAIAIATIQHWPG